MDMHASTHPAIKTEIVNSSTMLQFISSILITTQVSSFILLHQNGENIIPTTSKTTYLNAAPSWKELESQLPSVNYSPPINIDSALNPSKPTYSSANPTLFRERHGWCPYSERVWYVQRNKGESYHFMMAKRMTQ